MLRVDVHERPFVFHILRTMDFGVAPTAVRMPGGTDTRVWPERGSPEPATLRIYPAGADAAQEKEEAFLRHLGRQGLPLPQVWVRGVLTGETFLFVAFFAVCARRRWGLNCASPWKATNWVCAPARCRRACTWRPSPMRSRPCGHP